MPSCCCGPIVQSCLRPQSVHEPLYKETSCLCNFFAPHVYKILLPQVDDPSQTFLSNAHIDV